MKQQAFCNQSIERVGGSPLFKQSYFVGLVVVLCLFFNSFYTVNAEVIINEIHINPDVKVEPVEFIELYNNGNLTEDLSGYTFNAGITFVIPPGTLLTPGNFLLLAENPTEFQAKFGSTALGPWVGKLSNDGELLRLVDAQGNKVDEVDYGLGFPWPLVGGSPSQSFELLQPVFDNNRGGNWRSSVAGPSPGSANSVITTNAPPRLRQVNHSPKQPASGAAVLISIKASDLEDAVLSVTCEYQLVDPGSYINIDDALYTNSWTPLAMVDNGVGGDLVAGDDVYSVTLPGALQTHRRLVRYRIKASDNGARTVQVPYADDFVSNFAYFVYDGVPTWSGAVEPGAGGTPGQVINFSTNITQSLPVYHLISKQADVEDATWLDRYTGSDYLWEGTLVYNGKVYDHIRYRARGGVWRYAMAKNMWKFDFNRGHGFQAHDNYGNKYPTKWDKLNFGANIQQRNFWHRGEQGMFESVGYELFRLAGIPSSFSHFTHFRIIDEAGETGGTQYDGDFWGLYLGIEQLDGEYLDSHNLPDGNLYKMESGTGTLNNQGATAVTDTSDLDSFISTYEGGAQTKNWWRNHLYLPGYYSYRAIVEAIHHYDIANGKNYFYYLNPDDGKWAVLPWDLDLTWGDNMFGTGEEPFESRVLAIGGLNKEYQARMREIRDLIYNDDEGDRLIDNLAKFIDPSGASVSFVDMDRMRWDYNPIMDSSTYSSALNKARTAKFYQGNGGSIQPPTPDFPGMVEQMKLYISSRGSWIDNNIIDDSKIPDTPTVSYTGPVAFPADALVFSNSAFSDGSGNFKALSWRIGEVTDTNAPAYDAQDVPVYEVSPVWESGALATFNTSIEIPAGAVKTDHSYRLRVRHQDSTKRWSHWSAAVQFNVGPASSIPSLLASLKISEVMYHAGVGADFDFIEFWNSDQAVALDLSGVEISDGIDFSFPPGTLLAANSYLILAKAPGAAFDAFYSTGGLTVLGPYSGSLANGGEKIKVEAPGGGADIISFTYSDERSWPLVTDGAGHSLVPLIFDDQQDGRLSHPLGWRASAHIKGSPGFVDPVPVQNLAVNELAAHTDFNDPGFPQYDSNDWIELFNRSGSIVSFTNYYLSDDPGDLDKWALPAGSVAANAWVSFDEVTGFHQPITEGFGLNKNGEAVLLSYLPTSGVQWVEDAVVYIGQDNGATWGRFTDGAVALQSLAPTRNTANILSLPPSLIIREIMFAPLGGDSDLEYIELYNPTDLPTSLQSLQGPWRIHGGVEYSFPSGLSVLPGQYLLLVGFDPSDSVASNNFVTTYNLTPGALPFFGPFIGNLASQGEWISLQRPLTPDLPDTTVPWVVVDEVYYATQGAWPPLVDGEALHRIPLHSPALFGGFWKAFPPSPSSIFSSFAIDLENPSEGVLELSWPGELGAGYQVERTFLQVLPPTWTPVNFQNGAGLIQTNTLPLTGNRAWYRIRRVD